MHWLKKASAAQKAFDCANYLATGAFRNRPFEPCMLRLSSKFLGKLLDGEKQDRDLRMGARNGFCRLKTIHLGHREIHHDDIGAEGIYLFDGILTVLSITAHNPVLVILY